MRLKSWTFIGALFLVAACTSASEEFASGRGAGGQSANVQQGSQQDLVVNVGDRIFFDFDKFELKAQARRTLKSQAEWLGKNQRLTVTIEGHTDERGTREYNLALGERRATTIKNYLIEQGIDSGRITTISFGKERPVAVGSSEVSWSQNRRGVTTVN